MNKIKVIGDLVIENKDDLYLCLNPNRPDWFVSYRKAIETIKLMDGTRTLDDIVSALAGKFDIPPEELKKDAEELILLLDDKGMLESSEKNCLVAEPERKLQMVWLHITHRCNLRCKYCYTTAGDEMEKEMTTEEVINFIDQFHEMGGEHQTMAISGGEPLMREDLWEVVAHARKYGISLLLATNGKLVDKTTAQKIKENFVAVQVSLDGPKECHDEMRGSGSYDYAIQAIENLVEAGISPYINAVVTKKNYMELAHLVEVAHELGLTSVKSPPLMVIGKGEDSQRPTIAQLCEAWWLMDIATRKLRSDVPLDSKKTAIRNVINKYGCGAALNSISVDADGSIYPCQASQRQEFLAGNIRNLPLAQIWENAEAFGEWRNATVDNIEECSTCNWRYYCGGGCRMHAYAAKGTIMAPDRHCALNRRMFEESIWTNTMLKMGREYDVDERWKELVEEMSRYD